MRKLLFRIVVLISLVAVILGLYRMNRSLRMQLSVINTPAIRSSLDRSEVGK